MGLHEVNQRKKWFAVWSFPPVFSALVVLVPQGKRTTASADAAELIVQLAIGVGVVA